MDAASLQTLYAYNRWANHQLLGRARQTSTFELNIPIGPRPRHHSQHPRPHSLR
jgi:uncharacterized damage-inducible protein DinB